LEPDSSKKLTATEYLTTIEYDKSE